MILDQQFFSKGGGKKKKKALFSPPQIRHDFDRQAHSFRRKDRFMNVEKVKYLKRKKPFFPWVSPAVVAAGSVRSERPAVQNSSEPWALPVEVLAVSMSRLPGGREAEEHLRRMLEKLLGTCDCTFVRWHLRKIAQELLGHVAHVAATLQLLFLLLRYNVSKHLKRMVSQQQSEKSLPFNNVFV